MEQFSDRGMSQIDVVSRYRIYSSRQLFETLGMGASEREMVKG